LTELESPPEQGFVDDLIERAVDRLRAGMKPATVVASAPERAA
jgi:hypothetical protein